MQKNLSTPSEISGITFQPVVLRSQANSLCRTVVAGLARVQCPDPMAIRSLATPATVGVFIGSVRLIWVLLFSFLEWNSVLNISVAQGIPKRVGIQQVEEEEDEAPDVAVVRGALPRMNRQQMEEYMYGSMGGSKAAFHKLKRESIRRELDRVNSICKLTDEQWSKLNEAIDLDIQHIENRITSLLSGYDGKMTPQMLQEMQQKISQFASSIESNKTDRNLICYKVLKSQLTKDQSKLIESDDSRKRANLARTMYLRHLLSLQRKLGLSSNQRLKLEEWLKQEKNQETDFVKLCGKMERSAEVAEILNPTQLNSLKEFPAMPLQQPVLPMRLIKPLPAIQAPAK